MHDLRTNPAGDDEYDRATLPQPPPAPALPMPDAASDRLAAIVHERDGIPYDHLVHFARPLFEAYDVALDRLDAVAHGAEDEAPDDLALVLDTARLLWAYFAQDLSVRDRTAADLERVLLPHGARDEETEAYVVLLGELEERFQDHTEHASATADFGDVLREYLDLYPPVDPHADAADAIAGFARPLLDAADPTDLDAFDRQMDLAHALWDAAHAPDAATRDELLGEVGETFGIDDPAALLRSLVGGTR